MNKKRSYIYPNLLGQQFNVSNPFAILCADCTELKVTLQDNPQQKIKLFCVIDLCTSQIVTHYVFTRVSSKRMFTLINAHLLRKMGTVYEKQQTIIHSDRGSEFCNKNWALLDEDEYIDLSMSRMASPWDNAVIERFFGTLKRDSKILGQTKQYTSIPDVIENIAELRALINNIIFRYNTAYKPKRTQYTPPDSFYDLIYSSQNESPQAVIISSTGFDKKTTANIESYKKQLLKEQKDRLDLIDTKLKVINANQIQMATSIGARFDDVGTRFEDVMERLDRIDAKLTNSKKRTTIPRVIRDPLSQPHLELFLKTSLDYEPFISIRNKTAIILLCALGCRNSEIIEFTYRQLDSLINKRVTVLYIRKTNQKVFQPISKYHADLLELFYNDLILSIGEFQPDWYIFTSFKNKLGPCLTQKHFNEILNDSLRSFCNKCNLDNEYTTHSGRIGYVTTLLRSGTDISVVAKMVNHQDLRSTTKYDRYVIDLDKKKGILDVNYKGE